MSDSRFTEQEWEVLQVSVLWVFQGIAMADGVIEPDELTAFANLQRQSHKFVSNLADSVFQSINFSNEDFLNTYNLKTKIHIGLNEMSNIVAKSVDATDALLFKKSLLAAVLYVAKSVKSPKYRDVDEMESRTLKEIALSMRISPLDIAKEPSIDSILNAFD